jgi:hypothetical protein
MAEPRRHRLGLTSWKEVLPMTTGKKDASVAGRLLADPRTPKPVRQVAGSDLSQAKGPGKGKPK